jgi:phage/plasmid-like protein (TIGR03299 family)
MMYVGAKPWHELGTQLPALATSAEAMEAANLNWRVRKVPLYAAEFGRRIEVPGAYAIVRDDLWKDEDAECPVFGLVSEGYTPIQNGHAFEFLDSIVGAGAAVYETAGALGDGERVWMLVRLPDHLHIIGEDIAHKYLLLSSDHRGNGAVQVKFTPVRVVCNNTLTLALQSGSLIRVSHWRNARERLEAAKDTLGIINTQFATIEESYKGMLDVMMNRDLLVQYLARVFPEPEKAKAKQKEGIASDRAWAEHFFAEGAGNAAKSVKGTLWAAFNGVTELIDHRQPRNLSPQQRLKSVWFGKGATIKARAYELAVYLAKNKKLPDLPAKGPDHGTGSGKKRGLFRWWSRQAN